MGRPARLPVPARDRGRLKRLCRYAGRAPLANRRLSQLPDGRLLYRLKRRWRDGTTHVLFEPLELLEKLAVLVPPPRIHQARYHGLLGPAAQRRSEIVPGGRTPDFHSHGTCTRPAGRDRILPPGAALPAALGPSSSEKQAPLTSAARPPDTFGRPIPWAELLKRVFAVDVLECSHCGGRMRILAAIQTPKAIRAILNHLGLPSRAPPLAPAGPQAQSDTELPSDLDSPDA